MLKSICLSFFILCSIICSGQVDENRNICRLNCDPDIHRENTRVIYEQIYDPSVVETLKKIKTTKFPLRFALVTDTETQVDEETSNTIKSVVEQLNYSFRNTAVKFYIDKIEYLKSNLKIEDLSQNTDNIYYHFSQENDLENMITIYVLDHARDFCTITNSSISCSRTGGFSYILSGLTNNVVLSKFDLTDPRIVAHEIGHFFGLYHTFETGLFGIEGFDGISCKFRGDLICDTPPDPGSTFEIYVNYSVCEMSGFTDFAGNEFKPMLENIMSYYKPCYLKEYRFSPQQENVIKLASQLNIRQRLSK